MADVGRRAALGAAVAALGTTAALGDQPDALRGSVANGKVDMPKLHDPRTEIEGALPNADPISRKLGVAVVGLGHLSLDQILPGTLTSNHVRVTALVSGDKAKARVVAGQYGVPEGGLYDYTDFDRIKDNPAVDFVYIVLPNNMHAEFTLRAAAAGKHVLCEKPMANSVAEAQQMVTACKQADRLLMIAYRMQYDPYHRAVIKMVREKEYGAIRAISAVNGQNDAANGQWRQVLKQAGGGSLPDVGIYCLSAARYITGEEPVEITAQLTQPRDDPRFREIEDLCAFTLRFPSGVLAQCMSGYSHHESRHLRVMTTDAYIEMDPAFSYQGLAMHIGRKAGPAYATEMRKFAEKNQFGREMDHFAECIRANRQPHTPGEEGLQDQRLIAAIYDAARSGNAVRLPEIAGLDTTRGPPPADAA
jgi:predicted dehydrogenase